MLDRCRLVTLALAAALGGSLVMCAGAAPEPKSSPASAPAPAGGAPVESTEAPEKEPGTGPATPPPAPPAAAAPPPSQLAPSDHADVMGRRIAARAELELAARAVDAAGADCGAACRALGSMDRATQHMCAIAEDADDRRRCDDAMRRLLAARERVRAACGACS